MSEWLCARIAFALGIPVPPCDILRLDLGCFETWRAGRDCPSLVTATNPFVFASLNVPESKDVTDPAELADEDPVVLAQIYSFDEFIRNTDRTDYNSNLLINGGVHVIDHNNAFDPAFDSVDFARTHILRDFFAKADAHAKAAFSDRIHSTITVDFLETAWSEMPDAWVDAGCDVCSFEAVLDALKLERR